MVSIGEVTKNILFVKDNFEAIPPNESTNLLKVLIPTTIISDNASLAINESITK